MSLSNSNITKYLSVQLSKKYPSPGNYKKTEFEQDKDLRIEERRDHGDITRDVYFKLDNEDKFVGYLSFLKNREDQSGLSKFPYAICFSDGEGISYHKDIKTAVKKFSSKAIKRIEDIIIENKDSSHDSRYPRIITVPPHFI